MMTELTFVNRKDILEFAVHQFCVDASTLGLKPGQWPRILQTNAGNELPFAFSAFHKDGSGATYRQVAGCISLRVLND